MKQPKRPPTTHILHKLFVSSAGIAAEVACGRRLLLEPAIRKGRIVPDRFYPSCKQCQRQIFEVK